MLITDAREVKFERIIFMIEMSARDRVLLMTVKTMMNPWRGITMSEIRA